MDPDDQPGSKILVVGHVRKPLALLSMALLLILVIAWLIVTSGDLTIPAAWDHGK